MFASNSEDPHLFADHIDGGFVMEFDREYKLINAFLLMFLTFEPNVKVVMLEAWLNALVSTVTALKLTF